MSAPNLPALVVGTSWMGSIVPGLAGDRSLLHYLDEIADLGLIAFDLAASYQAGGTERLLGRWLKRRGGRDKLILISKGGHPVPLVAPHRLGPSALCRDLHGSLKRLGTDYLDGYLLHRDDSFTPLESIAETLHGFWSAGKIRSWGLSNWHHERLRALTQVAKSIGLPPPSISSPHVSLFSWKKAPWPGCVSIAHDSVAERHYEQTDTQVLAWSPLGAGYARTPPMNTSVYDHPTNEIRRQRALQLAERLGQPIESVLLAYLWQKPYPVYPVVASRVVGHLAKNYEARFLRLDEEDLQWLLCAKAEG